MKAIRRLGGPQKLLVAAVAATIILGLLLAGVGPDLPGPKLRETLGLVDEPSWEPCTPTAEGDRTPAGGPPGSWRREEPLPEPRDELRAATVGHLIYLAGGNGVDEERQPFSLPSFSVFNTRTERYRDLPDLPVGLDHPLMVASKGAIYVAGGASNGDAQERLYRFEPETEEWAELASMESARYAPAGGVIDGRIYVAGGALADRGETFSSMEVYDIATDTWSSGPEMPTARHHAYGDVLDGDLYVAGGRQPGEFSLAAFERFDPDAGAWEELPPIPEGVGGPVTAAANGIVAVIGGGDDLEVDGLPPWVTGATWAFLPDSDRWRRLPDLLVPRHGHAATVVGDRAFVFGGAPCALYGRTELVESLELE